MSFVKRNHRLGQVVFAFDQSGEVESVDMDVSYDIWDDIANIAKVRLQEALSPWDSLTVAEKQLANQLGKRLRALGEGA
jgi:hypothetical protein